MHTRFYIIILAFTTIPVALKAQSALSADIQLISQQNDLMGAALVTFCADGLLEEVYIGLADHQRNIPVTDSTYFRIASVSKLVTAMAFMTLVDNGDVDLDDDISSLLGYTVQNPFFSNTPITPRMLLSHQSSIIDGPTYSNFLSDTYTQTPIPDLAEILTTNGVYYNSATFNQIQPGTYFNYSNLNYVIIGTLIEKISGQRFDDFCENQLLLPLQISGSFNVTHLPNLNNLAVLYRKPSGIWTAQADDYQGVPPVFTNLVGYQPGTNGGRFAPQGGLRCTARDMTKLLGLLLNDGIYNGQSILSSAAISELLSAEWTYNGSNGNNYFDLFNSWGLGVHRILNTPNGDSVLAGSMAMYGHPGEAYGLVSDAYVDTSRELGFVFITNGSGVGYQVGGQSAFYTVEKDVFTAIERSFDSIPCASLGILESESMELRVLPTAFSEGFVVELSRNESIRSLELYNREGKLIRIAYQTNQMKGLESLAPGVYLLQVTTQKGDYSTFVVKE